MMLNPRIVGGKHYTVAREVRKTLAEYEDLKDIIAMLGLEELSREDRKTVKRARRLERFLTQPFYTTEHFTGMEGRQVDLEETISGCARILNDEFSEAAESDLYMIGAIDDVKNKSGTPDTPRDRGTEEKKPEKENSAVESEEMEEETAGKEGDGEKEETAAGA
jgi:F-type H+-transporting ATPase subunit beta